MTKAGWSLSLFALYVGFVGALLIFVPNAFLNFLGFPPTREIWIRIVGMCFGGLAFYYGLGALKNFRGFMQLTVYARGLTLPFFSIMVVLSGTKPILLVFGVIDLLGAIWTQFALREPSTG